MSRIHFKETQRYKDKLIPLALGVVGLMAVVRGMNLLQTSNAEVGTIVFLFALALASVGAIFALYRLKLKLSISDKKIKYKLSPWHSAKQSILWQDVDSCKIVQTSEAAQWSGGNITFNHEKRFTLSGRNGLALKTKSGERYFIGCEDILGLRKALDKVQE